jgi:hypothetical protein
LRVTIQSAFGLVPRRKFQANANGRSRCNFSEFDGRPIGSGALTSELEPIERMPDGFRLTPEALVLSDGNEIEFTRMPPDASSPKSSNHPAVTRRQTTRSKS